MELKRYLPHFLASGLFLILLFAKFDPHFGFSELAGFGADYERVKTAKLESLSVYEKPDSTGYDGQFYTQIALDPALSDPALEEAIDHPSYRARRILLPVLAFVLGLGQPALILQLHSLLNVGFLALTGWLLLRWAPATSAENFARWFFCIFSLGALESVRYSLADLPVLTLGLATIALLETARPKTALAANALAALTKETSLIHAVLFLAPNNENDCLLNRLTRAILAFAIAAIPLAIWMLYVSHRFPLTVNSADNIELPFSALTRAIIESWQNLVVSGPSSRYTFRLIAIAGLIFQFLYLLVRPQPRSRLWLFGIAYALLFVTLGDAVWRGYWAGCRILLPLNIAFNLLLSDRNKPLFWTAIILTNLSFLHGIIRWL